MSFERIPFPNGQTPVQLYNHQVAMTRELKRIFQDITGGSSVDLTVLQEDIAALRDDVDTLLAGGGGGGSLTPQEQFELSLVTATSDVLGSLSNIYERLRSRFENDADATMLAAISANKANTGLKTEIRVRTEERLALAQQITTTSAALGVTNAQVVALTQSVVDGDNALATQITSLNSQVAGNTAQVNVIAASVNGIETRFAVQLNNNGEVTGWIQLDGSAAGSVFTVAADKFQVSQVGTTGGTAVPVFAIANVNGTTKMALRGDILANNTIFARHIQAGSITADKIAAISLAAISANLGTVTAGILRDPANKYFFNLGTGVLGTTNGRVKLDLANERFTMGV